MTAVMTTPALGRRLTGARKWFVRACLGGAVVGLAIGVGVSTIDPSPPRRSTAAPERLTEAQRADLAAFTAALDPVIAGGAQVVAFGLKPGIADVRDDRYAPEVLTTMADGWVAELTSLHAQLQGVAVDGSLSGVRELYLQSLAGYLEVATSLRAAITTDDQARRADLLEQAASAGRTADRTFDRADAALKTLTAGASLPQGE